MDGMLKDLNLELTGRHHSGIDDSRNIAKIAMTLMKGGLEFNQAMIWEQTLDEKRKAQEEAMSSANALRKEKENRVLEKKAKKITEKEEVKDSSVAAGPVERTTIYTDSPGNSFT